MGKIVEVNNLNAPWSGATKINADDVERVDSTVEKERCVIVFKSGREIPVRGNYSDISKLIWGDE